MNWMTSGRHRALYSQRGRRRQMHFPSQVQRQRVKSSSPPRSSQTTRERDSGTPWYIVPVGDDDESHDIRVLELERRGAMNTAEIRAEEQNRGTENATCGRVHDGEARSSPTQQQLGQEGVNVQDGKRENRCIFTPVKKARKFDQLSDAVPRQRRSHPSSIASGVDMRFFNDGEELPRKNRHHDSKQTYSNSAPSELSTGYLMQPVTENENEGVQHFNEKDSQGVQQPHYQNCLDDEMQACDARDSYIDQSLVNEDYHQALSNDAGECRKQRYFPHWNVNFSSNTKSNIDLPFDRPSDEVDIMINPPPKASPLSFRMSRAEVVQSQRSTKSHSAVRDLVGNRTDSTSIQKSSSSPFPSPTTSLSSQGSLVLGRPPIGWQRKMMLSLNEETIATPKRFNSLVSSSFSDQKRTIVAANSDGSSPLEPPSRSSSSSPRSSAGSDENSIVSGVVPHDAKERIMAAASQQLLPDLKSNDVGADSIFTKRSMAFKQSWVMSSRTKTILDKASLPKASSTELVTKMQKAKYQEMESVAVYMYTLVQCYRINENICKSELIEHASSPEGPSLPTLEKEKQAVSRREILFSPKRT